jgi:hypothetical protein
VRKSSRLFRLATTVALTALMCDAVLPFTALAQPAPPPLLPPGEGRPDLNQADPPERVGRIASMTGSVSFHNPGDTQWSAATPNYPVSSGNSFWTDPSAGSQLEISACRIAMAGGTEFDVATLDGNGLQGVAAQGEIYLHLHDLAPNEVWSIQTPRGMVRLGGEGRYDIVVGTTDQPTLVTVVEGSAQIDGPGVSLQAGGSQTATITGTDTFRASLGPVVPDPFLTAMLNAERPRPAPPAAVPVRAVYAMAGGSDLVGVGSWSQAPEYGQVWYPPVPAPWVPYREGHWAYVAPWGWTWIDDAPWGFAPFHYGRWIQIGGRWGWTPGAIVVAGPPVYAPALVTFIGIGAGLAVGAALASGSIGWVPLGPHEEYHPWYHASNTYMRQVNIGHVTNITNNVTINNYVNRGAATSVPVAAMTGSRPVQTAARPVTAQEFAAARPISGQQPIRPTALTAGVTPAVARRLSLAPAAAIHPAPGPAIRPVAAGTTGFARPTLASVQRTQAPGSAEPGHPAQAARPAGAPPPGSAHPPAAPEAIPPGHPATARPETAPAGPHPVTQQTPQAAPHPTAARPTAPPAPRPHPEAAPEAAHTAPRPEQRHAAPHPETPPAAPPHPQARPAAPSHPEPQGHKQEPGER